jgi:hypothetical protein
MSCCRATPEEYLAEKLLDIEASANYRLGALGSNYLLHLRDPGVDFELFDRNSEEKLGTISFRKFDIHSEYIVHFRSNSLKKTLCVIDASFSGESIGFKLANSLVQL